MSRSIRIDTQPRQGRLFHIGCAHIYDWLHVGDSSAQGESLGIPWIDDYRRECGGTIESHARGGGNILHDCGRHKSLDC